MALDATNSNEFEIEHDQGSGRSKTRVKTKFRLDKKYEPIKVLGHGAYGVVISALNKETGGKVAIKKMMPISETRVDGVHALREVRLMRWLGKHQNIIKLKDLMINVDDDELYLVMELMDSDLHRIIQSHQVLEDAHFKHFMYQLLRGLRFAHAHGVIHRDLKPANLLVTKACDLVISDFGLARQVPEDHDKAMTEHVVTRWYRAPELMLSADGHYTQSVDVWACGCIFAELLGRTPLFPGNDFKQTLAMQMEILGSRPADELDYIKSEEAIKFLNALPHHAKKPWSVQFPEASAKALDLLDKMLQFHPIKRITVEDAMRHPYFDSVRSQYTDPDPELPLGPGGFDFSFEEDKSVDGPAFRALLIEEALAIRAEREVLRRATSDTTMAGTTGASGGAGATAAAGTASRGAALDTGAGAMPAAGARVFGAGAGGAAGPATVVKG